MAEINGFEGCDSEHVFAEVERTIQSSEIRTLWRRLQEEMDRKATGAAITYLEGEFQRIRESLNQEMKRLEL